MKELIKERLDWVSGNFAAQLVFFAIGSVFCLKGLSNGTHGLSSQLYLTVSFLLLAVAAMNAIVSFGILRQFFGLLFVLANCFVIPFSFNSYGVPLSEVALVGMLYAIITIAAAPRFVGLTTLAASIAFACYLRYDSLVFQKTPVYNKDLVALERRVALEGEDALKKEGVRFFKVPKEMNLQGLSSLPEIYGDAKQWEFLYFANKSRLDMPERPVQAGTVLIIPALPKVDAMSFVKLGLWFVAGALLAFCWRLLIGKMYELYMLSMKNSSKAAQRQMDSLNDQLESAKKEYRLLKEEVSMQIIEMNKITGFKK